MALSCSRAMSAGASRQLSRIGIQLYTVRSLMAKDVDGTLARLAEIGYGEVEFAGYFNRSPAQIRAVLATNRLASPSTHVQIPADDDAWSRTLDVAREVGHEWVVIAYVDESLRRTPDVWARFADRFNVLAAKAKDRGLRFAYHNHDFEFVRVGDRTGYDVLLSRTDPALVDFEMDLYWVTKAGADPLDLFSRYPHRFPLLHAKDATAAPARAMADVGSGTIEFAQMFGHAEQSGMQHVYVERDDAPDPLASARNSFRYLSALRYNT